MPIQRNTVDLSPYPDLVVIYLGMRVQSLRGFFTMLGFGPRIAKAVAQNPDGLLRHESMIYSFVPVHVGMRQYWRDFESLESWARSLPHQEWWKSFLGDPGGTGFWHETYSIRGGMECVFDNVAAPLGLSYFAPVVKAKGPMFGARGRLKIEGEAKVPPAVAERDRDGF